MVDDLSQSSTLASYLEINIILESFEIFKPFATLSLSLPHALLVVGHLESAVVEVSSDFMFFTAG